MNIAIIGAGAAGCFAAANISHTQGVEVAVFEKTAKVLQKVKVSGGGRCNVTNQAVNKEDFNEDNPFAKEIITTGIKII